MDEYKIIITPTDMKSTPKVGLEKSRKTQGYFKKNIKNQFKIKENSLSSKAKIVKMDQNPYEQKEKHKMS